MSADLATTRASLHAVAEHVLAAARYAATGRIGLEATPEGFATPAFGDPPTTVSVEGTEVVVRGGGAADDGERRAPITTLRAAAALAGIEPGAPAAVYRPATPGDPDVTLEVDPGWAGRLTDWLWLGTEALQLFSRAIESDGPGAITLWPEHFDVAILAADVTYGASLGDAYVDQPYLYVGLGPIPEDDFWNQPFGASRPWGDASSVDDALAFYGEARRRAGGLTPP